MDAAHDPDAFERLEVSVGPASRASSTPRRDLHTRKIVSFVTDLFYGRLWGAACLLPKIGQFAVCS
jgi:hypothetical protein